MVSAMIDRKTGEVAAAGEGVLEEMFRTEFAPQGAIQSADNKIEVQVGESAEPVTAAEKKREKKKKKKKVEQLF